MIIIFGWMKEQQDTPNFTQCYCYNCSEVKRWALNTETEWVTFFAIKTIPFLTKRKIYCERCGDILDVSNRNYSTIKNNAQFLAKYIENAQLAKKTEIQRKYLLERREQIENE